MGYLGECKRRRIASVLEGPIFERWVGTRWEASDTPFRRRGRYVVYRDCRVRLRFRLWPCGHEVTFRLRKGDFPTRAMGREPHAIAAWIGRDCPCPTCGPAGNPEDRFRGPKSKAAGFSDRHKAPKRRKGDGGGGTGAAPEPAELSPAEKFEQEQRMMRSITQPLAELYDS